MPLDSERTISDRFDKLTLEELESAFGLKAQTGRQHDIGIVENKIKGFVAAKILNTWLRKQGLSDTKCSDTTKAKAYILPGYLKAWRRSVNPQWDLLSGGGNGNFPEGEAFDPLNEDEDVAPAGEAPKPQEKAEPQNSAQTEAWLKTLFNQIDGTVNKLVAKKLAETTLKLDETAKAQIRSIAEKAAKDTIEINAIPREIVITNSDTNISINIGMQHERFPVLLRAVNARDHRGFRLNIWLTGPTGSGKTTAGENVAKALSFPFGSDGSLDADYKVLGFRDANGNIISTQFLEIYKNGGIYIADEIDNWMPSALLSLNAALANGWATTPEGLVARHKDACIIACANTWGLGATSDYVGRTKLDAASLDRFQPKIDWPYDERLERAIAERSGGIIGLEWHDQIIDIRAAAKRQGLKIIISPRATYNGIALLKSGFSVREVLEMTVASGLAPEQKKSIGIST